jgi:hypothetical protein
VFFAVVLTAVVMELVNAVDDEDVRACIRWRGRRSVLLESRSPCRSLPRCHAGWSLAVRGDRATVCDF